jgi:hypothetical protein
MPCGAGDAARGFSRAANSWIDAAETVGKRGFRAYGLAPERNRGVVDATMSSMNFRVRAAFVIAVSAPAASAHHAIAGVYEGYAELTLDAVVTEFRFVNPHPKILVSVTSADGVAQNWTLEMDNRWELAELGFEVETLRPGDRIIVAGNPGRNVENALYVRKLERPADGFNYTHHP